MRIGSSLVGTVVAALAAGLALHAAPVRAEGRAQRAVTDAEVERVLPILRVRAKAIVAREAVYAEGVRITREAEREQARMRAGLAAGTLDPLRELSGRGVPDLVPPGFRYDPACSLRFSRGHGRSAPGNTIAVLTSTRDGGRPVCVGMTGIADVTPANAPALAEARRHLERLGFEPRKAPVEERGLRRVRVVAELYGSTCLATTWKECAGVATGPLVLLRDEVGDAALDQVITKGKAAADEADATIARAVRAAGLSQPEWERIVEALQNAYAVEERLPKDDAGLKALAPLYPPNLIENAVLLRRHPEAKTLVGPQLPR